MESVIEESLGREGKSLATPLRTLDQLPFDQMLDTRVAELQARLQELEVSMAENPGGLLEAMGAPVADPCGWSIWCIR